MEAENTNLNTETPPSNLGLGSYLRAEREKRHITIDQVASATKVSIKLLHALENDNFSELPAKPFVRGFVASYARFLHVEPTEILSRYDSYLAEQAAIKFKRTDNAPHIFVGKEAPTDTSKTVLSIVMVGFLVVGAGSYVILKPTLKQRRHRAADRTAASTTQITNDQLYTVTTPPNAGTSVATPTPDAVKEETEIAATAPVKTEAAKKTETPKAEKVEVAKTEIPKTEPKKTEAPKAEPAKKTEAPKAEVVKKPETPEADKKPASVVDATKPSNAKWPTIPPGEVKHMLVVQAVEDSWIKYQADDFPMKQYTLKKGQKIFVRARSSIRFRCFKTNGVELSPDNKEFKILPTTLTMVIPKEASDNFKEKPFSE